MRGSGSRRGGARAGGAGRVAWALAAMTALLVAPGGGGRAEPGPPGVAVPGWHGDPASFDRMIPALQAAGLTVLDFDPHRPGPQALYYAPTADGQHTVGGFGRWNASGGDMRPGSPFLHTMGVAEPPGERYVAIGGAPPWLPFPRHHYAGAGVAHGYHAPVPAEAAVLSGHEHRL